MAHSRRGSATVLAMMFLVIFAMLGLAFYAMVTVSVAVARNDRNSATAEAALQSGMEYTKYVLSSVVYDPVAGSGTTLERLCAALDARYGSQPAFASHGGIAQQADGSIRIPASANHWLTSASAQPGRFYAVVSMATGATEADPVLQVTVYANNAATSADSLLSRQVDFKCNKIDIEGRAWSSFDFGVAANGVISGKDNLVVRETSESGYSALMASGVQAGIAITSTVNNSHATYDGTVWTANGTSQLNLIDAPCNLLDKPLVFPTADSLMPTAAQLASDFETYDTLADCLKATHTKKRFYIRYGDATTRNNGVTTYSNTATLTGVTIPGAVVFGPDVTVIDIEGKGQSTSQIPTRIQGDPGYPYGILAPHAQMIYNGNTGMPCFGYIVVDQFQGNSTNSASITIDNGGLVTLSKSASSCALNQVSLLFHLPPAPERPDVTSPQVFRSFQMDYGGYTEANAY
jgi:hypothetical protein